MQDFEVLERLTKAEERTKSNTHRLDKLEPIVNEIHTMSNTMVQLVEEVKHTNETVSSLDEKVERMDSRVDIMERSPADDIRCTDIKKGGIYGNTTFTRRLPGRNRKTAGWMGGLSVDRPAILVWWPLSRRQKEINEKQIHK